MRAALYLRVSTPGQAEAGLPIDGQRRACREYAAGQGWEVAGEYADEGISGADDERPGLLALLDAADARRFGKVLAWDWSRIARDADFLAHVRYRLRRAGVELVSVSRPDAHALERTVTAWADEDALRKISEASRRGRHRAAELGMAPGGRAPFGYRWEDKVRLVAVPAEALQVLRAYELAAGGSPLLHVARAVGWTRTATASRLRSPVYVGTMAYPRAERPVTIPGHHAPMVPWELWQAVQTRLEGQIEAWRPRLRGRAPLALSAVLRCAPCDSRLRRWGRYVRPSGPERVWYSCPSCRRVVRIDDGAATVLRLVLAEITRSEVAEALCRIAQEAHAAGSERGHALAEIASLTRSERSLTAALESGEIEDPREIARRLGDVQRRLRTARATARRSDLLPPTVAEVRARLDRMAACAELLAGEDAQALETRARAWIRAAVDAIDIPAEGEATIRLRVGGIIPLPASAGSPRSAGLSWSVPAAGLLAA